MVKESVGVAAVGLGRWAKVLADAIRRSDRLELVSCFSRSEKNREAFSKQYGCRAANTYGELLKDSEVEGVTPTGQKGRRRPSTFSATFWPIANEAK